MNLWFIAGYAVPAPFGEDLLGLGLDGVDFGLLTTARAAENASGRPKWQMWFLTG